MTVPRVGSHVPQFPSEWAALFPHWADSELPPPSYASALLAAVDAAAAGGLERGDGPVRATTAEELDQLVQELDVFPEYGRPLEDVLDHLGRLASRFAVDVAHPSCAAHLQCRPLTAALGAEVLITSLNQSMDSWDQAPIATHIEMQVLQALGAEVGLEDAMGLFTVGGTQSNLMALLLARNQAGSRSGRDVHRLGLSADATRYRILCSSAAHFSVHRSASVLGIGTDAVMAIATTSDGSMDPSSLDEACTRLRADDLLPVAIVATAGTTDQGAVDPLSEIATCARRHHCWLHVDAAYGGALLFSPKHRALLKGIELADSISIDFHKLLWQPIPCGVLLVARSTELAALGHTASYLNPVDDVEAGMKSLVGLTPLQTSRRFDALKVLVTFQALGRRTIAELVDRTLELAKRAAALILEQADLELYAQPRLGIVLFRYRPTRYHLDDRELGLLNAQIRRSLLASGSAVVGRTDLDAATYLKLTFVNPLVSEEDLAALIGAIVRTGRASQSRLQDFDEQVDRSPRDTR